MTPGTLLLALLGLLIIPMEGHARGISAAVIVTLHAAWWAVSAMLGGWPCSAG